MLNRMMLCPGAVGAVLGGSRPSYGVGATLPAAGDADHRGGGDAVRLQGPDRRRDNYHHISVAKIMCSKNLEAPVNA